MRLSEDCETEPETEDGGMTPAFNTVVHARTQARHSFCPRAHNALQNAR